MNTNPLTRLTRRTVAVLSVAALLLAPTAFLASAEAKAPDGSHGEVILESKDATGQPWNATLNGWWGHEGGTTDAGVRPTYLSMDVSDGHGVVDDATIAALHEKLDDGGSFDTLRVAFVPYSADGHNERPRVTRGENAGQAFAWFSDLGFGSNLNGTKTDNDIVAWVSTLAEYSKWWDAGRPVQAINSRMQVLDANDGDGTAARSPQGKSLLDRWPAGTKISMVFYVSDGVDKKMPQVPTVKVGPDGRALTSWLTFETVASPTHSARTSAGYKVLTGQGTGPGVAARPKTSPTAGSNPSGAPTDGSSPGATNASGSSPASAEDASTSDGGFVESLPGGAPTFWVLLILLVAGVVLGVTAKLRTTG